MVSAVVGLVLLALVLAAAASVLVGVALRGRRGNRSVAPRIGAIVVLACVLAGLTLKGRPATSQGNECDVPVIDLMSDASDIVFMSDPSCVTASRLHTAAGVALAIVPAVGWWIAWGRGRRRA